MTGELMSDRSLQGQASGVSTFVSQRKIMQDEIFVVKLTDSPAHYAGLRMQLNSVDAWAGSMGWVPLRKLVDHVDVMELTNGRELAIADDSHYRMRNRHYKKLRLSFGEQNVLSLRPGPEEEKGVDLVPRFVGKREYIFELPDAMKQHELLIDFDVMRSVLETGREYLLSPSMRIVEDRETGIRGHVQGDHPGMLLITDGREVISAWTDPKGNFLVRGLKPGVYTLYIMPLKQADKPVCITNRKFQKLVVQDAEMLDLNEIGL